jgi:acetyl esterase/lipase
MRRYHPQVEALRREREAQGMVPVYEQSVEEARRADLAAIQEDAAPPEPVAEVVEERIPGPDGADLPIRVFRPSTETPLPALLYFFGGGWVVGELDTCDAICRRLANGSGCAIVTVGYRLAPEHRFPAAVEDCYAAARWLGDHGARLGLDPARLAVGGDSAGGNLAAVVAQLARERGGPPLRFQLLVYPVTDHLPDTASMRDNDDPYFFNRRSAAWYWSHYLTSEYEASSPLASPLKAADLAGLPPALVITAELDPLCDEGEAYAERLRAAGVPVELTRYDGMIHGFFAMTGKLDAAEDALGRAAAALRRALVP